MLTLFPRLVHPIAARLASLAGLAMALSCGWLATMELVLRHPGYGWRSLLAAMIVAEGALTIAVLQDLVEATATAVLRWPLTVGAVVTALLGAWIVAEDLARPGLPAGPHFEGYLLIIGLALIAYGALTIVAMATAAPGPSLRASAPRS